MNTNLIRAFTRRKLAKAVCHASFEDLTKYGISSYREITGLDRIGIPIFIANRPLAVTISVTAGKNMDPMLACAGAIIEGIEFWAAENPTSGFLTCSHRQLSERSEPADILPLQEYPLAADNVLSDDTVMVWETVDKLYHTLGDKAYAWMPSNMIWMRDRVIQQFLDVQQSSNGLASGASLNDGILQGLYELIERDGWTINAFVRENTGSVFRKISMDGLPDEIQMSVDMIERAGLFPFLYDCTTDLGVPVVACALFGHDGVGLFGGYGCSLNAQVAIQRALLEAVQSRLCYISGARDDLYRRDFLLMKQSSSAKFQEWLKTLPEVSVPWSIDPWMIRFDDTEAELLFLRQQLASRGIDKIYYKQLAKEEFEGEELVVVKVICPQLEGAWCENWRTSGRAMKHLEEVQNV